MSTGMNQKTLDIMEKTLAYADSKVDHAEIILDQSDQFFLSAHEGKIDQYKLSNAHSIGIRVIQGNQVGISYTENRQPKSLHEMVNLAIENTTFMKEDPYQKLTTVQEQSPLLNVHAKNYQFDDTTTADKIALALALEEELKQKDQRITSAPYNGYQESRQERYLLNSEGVVCYEKSQYFTCYTSCLIQEGDQNGMHNHGSLAATFDTLNKEDCIEQSYYMAKELLSATSLKSGKYDVIFTPDCFKELLNHFAIIYSAKSTLEGKNPFKDKLGSTVFSDLISLMDQPHYDSASYYHRFDDEGVLKQDLHLIDHGVLKSFYHNTATAMELNVPNTGHAHRSTKGQLTVSGTTKVVLLGKTSQQALLDPPYLEIIKTQGLRSGSNAISGDFSFAISGFYHQNGDKIPFKGMTLSGNFYHLMKSQVSAVGDQMSGDTYRSFFTPHIRFTDVSVSGA